VSGGVAKVHVAGENDLSGIFLFKQPGIFFMAVEAVLLFQCFAISIVCTQLLPLNVSTAKNGGWYIGFILLIGINFCIIQMILNKSVLLRSVHSLERAIAGKVCEDTVGERNAIANLREVVTAKLLREKVPQKDRRAFLKTFFFQYDVRQTGEIGKADFLRLLGDLNIYMSKESFQLLWQVVDYDLSDKLDWLEISELFFPAVKKEEEAGARNDMPALTELRSSMHKMLEDAKIPVYNWEEHLHTAFKKYDTDGSDEIDEGEFGAMLTSLNVQVTTKVLKDVFSTIDLCQDGSISYDDFFAFVFPEMN
jgi:Ca2+-binding EF-hand superfamily protein